MHEELIRSRTIIAEEMARVNKVQALGISMSHCESSCLCYATFPPSTLDFSSQLQKLLNEMTKTATPESPIAASSVIGLENIIQVSAITVHAFA